VHHRTIQINHQPDANIFQFIILTFVYSSTGFGRFPAYHQELNESSGSLWFYLRIVVIVVACFNFQLNIFLEYFIGRQNIQRHIVINLGQSVKLLLLLSELTETDYSRQLLVKDPNKISKKSLQGKHISSMHTDRYDEASGPFPYLFYESVSIQILSHSFNLATVSFNISNIWNKFVL
jgi:hypothetical protein